MQCGGRRYAVRGMYIYPMYADIHTRVYMPKVVRWIQKQRVHDPRITESYIHIFPNPKPIDKHEYLFMVLRDEQSTYITHKS